MNWFGRMSGLAIIVIAGGCGAPHQPVTRIESQKAVVGQSVEGRDIACQFFGDGLDVVLLMATIHGNEAAGTPLLEKMAEYLSAHPEVVKSRRVLLLPVANPDGRSRNTRRNARGVDLNRNFPAANWSNEKDHGPAALSEPESRVIRDLIFTYSPSRIVTIHQPLSCVDYDGPPVVVKLAEAMAKHCELPVKHIGALPGSLGSYAGNTLQIPIITLELPNSASDLSGSQIWERYGKALLAAIRFPARN